MPDITPNLGLKTRGPFVTDGDSWDTDDNFAVLDVAAGAFEKIIEVNLSAEQLLSIGAAGLQIIPAPGAGKYIRVVSATFYFTHVTATYVATSLILFRLGTLVGLYEYIIPSSVSELFTNPVSAFEACVDVYPATSDGTFYAQLTDIDTFINNPLYLATGGGNAFTDGDGTARLRVRYAIEDVL